MTPILLSLMLGSFLAWTAANRPVSSLSLERLGGALLIFGLVALGFALSRSL